LASNIFRRGFLKTIWKAAVAVHSRFSDDKGLMLSASLAYYTVFSIAPLLILIMAMISIFFAPDHIDHILFTQIAGIIGKQSAGLLLETIKNLRLSGKTNLAILAGAVTLIIGATSIFMEIQSSLNIIWNIKAKPKRGWVKMLQNRLLAFCMVFGLGILLFFSLVINIIMVTLSHLPNHFLPELTILLINGINLLLAFILMAVLFGIILKFLPDIIISWKDVRPGAIFTAILFMLGKYLIGLYIRYLVSGSVYGAAGSVIFLLIWIYYTAVILYVGAEFTQVYARAKGSMIKPAEYAVFIQHTEVEVIVKELPAKNPPINGVLKAIKHTRSLEKIIPDCWVRPHSNPCIYYLNN